MIDDFLTGDLSDVEEAIRKAVATEITPRFRRLADDEIDHKRGPHDLVTAADRLAEEHLTGSLTALLPGSVVVGEESVHADPAVYGALRGDAPVWIVDPVDGTRQFVEGDPGFCTLVALAHRGELLASWTYAPVPDELAFAVRGGGALLDGRPLRAGAPVPGDVVRVAMSNPDFSSPEEKRLLLGLDVPEVHAKPCGSAGLEYLRVARGELDATVFSWDYAWDHAAGLLLVTEAGGCQRTVAGKPFDVSVDNTLPFTAARDEATARRLLALLGAPS
ncbi:inositol monophosphatase family protein [Streptomyces genisteinicus]|uniref:inositol-phosphate phosphatase n=1 Tax=Streptomyces genisteinicus TaxID=2768068 RepID=A0A7H0I0D9_9ACTN|nr:inositol monophosphatase family protein [Streptomyces genisteinicus]QNP66255.1 fructose-bisphosphatase class II [Streptomyces genisteinicus]